MFVRQLSGMAASPKKKKKKNTPYKKKETPPTMANEPLAVYSAVKFPHAKEYSLKKFDALGAKLPFTLKEWAAILHLSDRTIQRYIKDNKPFEGIYADRLFQIEKLIAEAAHVFKTPGGFYQWLQQQPAVLGHRLSIASLQTQDGIQQLLDELSRMQQGIYI
jgi:hypothetical protein